MVLIKKGQGCSCHQYVIENENKDGICLKRWTRFGDSCYHFGHFVTNHSAAMLQCHARGGHLAEINSEAENKYIANMSRMMQIALWLGGSDFVVQDEWLWVNSWTLISNYTYKTWGKGRPNNGDGRCLVMNDAQGRWYNVPCEKPRGFVCEMNIEKAMKLLKVEDDCYGGD